MSTFSLNLQIDAASLNQILSANLQVVVARPIGGSPLNVAWLAFRPFQQNSVEWGDDYSLFASQSSVAPGSTIQMMSMGAAQSGTLFRFADGSFSPAGSTAPGTVGVVNSGPGGPPLTFGLAQNAVVNGQGVGSLAENAVQLFPNQQAAFGFTGATLVWVGNGRSGTVISGAGPNATQVNFGGSVNSITLSYNAGSGRFVPQS